MNVEEEINKINKRNERVEKDKAWEKSKTRVLFILLITYITTATVFFFIGINNYLLNALIPTVGFYLSTLTLPFLKEWWVKKVYKNE